MLGTRSSWIAGAGFTVGMCGVLVLGLFHVKIDLYPSSEKLLPRPYAMVCSGTVSEHCDIDLTQEIKGAFQYRELMQKLRDAGSGDDITIHLMGYGGDAMTMIQLINTIKDSKATVTMSVEGPVYSAHTMLAMSGDKLVIKPGVMFMFHDVQVGKGGTPYDDPDPGMQATIALFHEVMINVAGDYLTTDELSTIFSGGEVYISGEDMAHRWSTHHDQADN